MKWSKFDNTRPTNANSTGYLEQALDIALATILPGTGADIRKARNVLRAAGHWQLAELVEAKAKAQKVDLGAVA